MTDSPGPGSEAAGGWAGEQESRSASDLVLKVLGAIGTGIGILGFVTFFGGAIIWVRADKAELPATEAVAVIPRSVLVTTGATFLFPALLIAVVVVAAVFLVDLIFYGIRENGLRELRTQARLLGRQASQLARSAVAAQQAWKAADAVLDSLMEDLAQARRREATGAEIAQLEKEIEDQQVEASRLQAASEGSVSAAAAVRENADDLTEQSQIELRRSPFQRWIEISFGILFLLFIVPLTNGAIFHGDRLETVVLILVAASGTALTLSAFMATEKFVWFGVVAFVAVGVYLAAATYFSTHRNAKMQPVAALRSGHAPVTGAFVAETSENLYVGTFRERGRPPRLTVIPRAQVSEIAIGPLLDEEVARRRATAMALNECAEEVEDPKAGMQAEQEKPACTRAQVEALTGGSLPHRRPQLDQPG